MTLLLALLLTGCGAPAADSDGGSASAAYSVLTEGAQEGDVLHFEGTDDGGNAFAADITAEGGGLLLTVAASGHPDCPAGTELHFAPAE